MTGAPIRIAMLGDSSAAGYGVFRDRDTPAAQLAIAISDVARRPVHVTNVAVVGAESQALGAQIDELGDARPELAVIMIGANDVTHRIKNRRGGAPPGGRGPAAARCATSRSSWAPAPTSAPSARSPSRCGPTRGGCRARWRPPRPSPWWARAGARCRSATCSGRCSPRARTCSATTSSTRAPPATLPPPTRCCPPRWTSSAWARALARPARSPPGCPSRSPGGRAGRRPARHRGRRHREVRRAQPAAAGRGRSCAAAGRASP